jgi:thioester reductase-like protein
METGAKVVLVTGWSGFIGRRLVHRLADSLDRTRDRLVLLTRTARLDEAHTELAALKLQGDVLEGDVTKMHLGLSGAEYKRLVSQVSEIWHLAGLYDLAADAATLRAVNLEGTRLVLELARASRRLERLHHFSTTYVSGDREGVILEDELDVGQGFHDPYERAKFQAERLVRRAMPELPATVYRPSIVVGDSRTGEVDRFHGPYYLAILLVASPLRVPLPLPGQGLAPLNVVPVDFVVEAALSLGANPAAVGKTVHLADPAPLSARKVYELIAARAGKTLPTVPLPHRAVEALLGLPVLERLARAQRNAIRMVNHLAIYNCQNQLELLEGTGIRCPPITSYLDRLIEFARARFAAAPRSKIDEDVEDPLDSPPGKERA